MEYKKNIVLDKSIEFSLELIDFCERLRTEKKFVIADQLLRSGTSIGANVHEAQNSESKLDFIHKIKIALKEFEETKYWMTLCEKSQRYPYEEGLKTKLDELGLILYKIISTSKNSLKK
ncbi:four helix bundle protein [Pontixanthobacter gangjinensis]|uniref:Four helix bundle protein n=1 Tax=Christiangramia aestuarii TaxID=1028746 RepID=A0A7K1LRR2_9FLAO|nr:four helix bundle protein [Christiangramia aestuarii]MUP43301.1 four helix bundle protein [Christiangramia aestuarii]